MFSKLIRADVELRLVEERHALEIYSVMDAHRKSLREWLPWVDDTTSVDGTREWIRGALEQFANGQGFQAGIWFEDSFVGVCGFQPIHRANRRGEIGYWLAPNAEGQGIMTAAVRALVDHAFLELGLNRVQIQCGARNYKSQAIPQRLGFVEEGAMQQGELLHGTYHDLITFRMLRSEWAVRSTTAV